MNLGRALNRLLHGTGLDPARAPLLESAEVAQLLAAGAQLDILAEAPPSGFVAGDRVALRAGNGLDFDDNRPYQAGDEARRVNWRLTARAGSMYVKVFREERRPCAFVLLDRRAAMRFATTGRLKAHHAAAAAISFAAAAAHGGTPVGGLVLDPDAHWLQPRPGPSGLHHLVRLAAAPAPPLSTGGEPSLTAALQQLGARLQPGCTLWLLSDFVDLADTDTAMLLQLSRRHRVRALQILDPAETTLTEAGILEVAPSGGGASISLDTQRRELRRDFEQLAQQQLRAQESWFASAGIPLRRLSTADPFEARDLVAAA